MNPLQTYHRKLERLEWVFMLALVSTAWPLTLCALRLIINAVMD